MIILNLALAPPASCPDCFAFQKAACSSRAIPVLLLEDQALLLGSGPHVTAFSRSVGLSVLSGLL